MWGAAVFSLIGLAFLVAESSGLSVELAPGQLSCLVHEAVRDPTIKHDQAKFLIEGRLIVPGDGFNNLNQDRTVNFSVTITQPDGVRIAFLGDVWQKEIFNYESKGFGPIHICIRSNASRTASVTEELYVHPVADDGDVVRSDEFILKLSADETNKPVSARPRERPANEDLSGAPSEDGGVSKPQSVWETAISHFSEHKEGSGELATKQHGKVAVSYAEHIQTKLDKAKGEMEYIRRRLRRHQRTMLSNGLRSSIFGYIELATFLFLAVVNLGIIRLFFSGEGHRVRAYIGGGFDA